MGLFRSSFSAVLMSKDATQGVSPADCQLRLLLPVVRRLDGLIRANRFADSRESPDSRESFQGSRIEPPSLRIAFQGA